MLTDVTVHDPNPFGDLPKDPAAEQRPEVDVSLAAMTRLRTPFEVAAEPTPPGDDRA
ncbi:hypothetical protein OG792_18145 [Micromonospora sp. NBC_01699]|uniref:hypothetical protein n=1 Tax=Micromonospora sp. NBC_01699 TaxID=2975984 RepID=UPI002E28B422|nr:hypothetical protein [Micromonospora sp. NBC_01699]